jgi:hypothetical protein
VRTASMISASGMDLSPGKHGSKAAQRKPE